METETQTHPVETLFDEIREYASTRLELWKLIGVERTAGWLSSIVTAVAVLAVAAGVLLFLGLSLGFLLGEWLGRYSYGFFIVTALMALAGLVVYLRRSAWVKHPIARLIITRVLND
jgi:hypothetical protein